MKFDTITHFSRPDRVIGERLHVIVPIINSPRYRVRWKHVEDQIKRVLEAGAVCHIIECAFGQRAFVVPVPEDNCDDNADLHVWHVRTPHELWLKENLINVALTKLPACADYIAWIDADVRFARDDWADETIHQLQHYKIIQMFSWYLDLNHDCEPIGKPRPGFMNRYLNPDLPPCDDRYHSGKGSKAQPGAPGLCWASRRKTLNDLGGLMDWQILGSADMHMAHALVGKLADALRPEYDRGYTDPMYEWQNRASISVGPQWVGMMKGLALHHFHGKKSLRQYGKRDLILIRNHFDPALDLKRDIQGVYQLTGHNPQLRDDVRKYFHARNEDSL